MVGDLIRKLRQKKGMTQIELGKMCEMSTVRICDFENGSRRPNLEELSKIASSLGVNVSFFFQHANDDDPTLSAEDLAAHLRNNPQQFRLMRKIRSLPPDKMEVLLSVVNALTARPGRKINYVGIVSEEK